MISTPGLIQKLYCVILALVVHLPVYAQKNKKDPKEKVPVYNYVIDDPMDVFGRQPVPTDTIKNVLLPEFYYRGERKIKDTLLNYECYNAANKIMGIDTIQNYTLIRYVSLIQRYTDAAHTYRTDDGKQLPIPTEKIIARYDKTGNEKWFSVDYATNKTTILQEHVSDIVRKDSTIVQHPESGNANITIYKYYRVSPVK